MRSDVVVSIVDDDQAFLDAVGSLVRSFGFRTACFVNAEAFLRSEERRESGCLITDLWMTGKDGIDLYRTLCAAGEAPPTIIVSAFKDKNTLARAEDAGIRWFLSKPLDADELQRVLVEALAAAGA